MLIVKLWHYIRGYVIINIKGRHLERLINLIHHNNILIWDIIKNGNSEITAKIELNDYEAINELAMRVSCEVQLVKKKGLTLWKWKLRTRKMFAVALLFVLFIIFIISSLVITVEFKGNEIIETQVLKEELAKMGLKPWVLKSTLKLDEIKLNFLKNHKDIEFMNIAFSGTKVIVDIVEEDGEEQIYDKSTPVDLIAKKDGIIKEILVINGTSNVEVDQKVKAGDLLVKGEYFIQKSEEDIEIVYVHAMAQILAQTEYHKTYEVKKYNVINENQFKINRVLHIGELVINFLKDGEESYYYGSSEEKKYNLFGITLPITLDKIKYYPKDNCVEKSDEELQAEVMEKATEELRGIGKINNISIESFTEGNNTNEYEIKITILEDIIQEQQINKEE
ncbi:MAG: sporulation protein YqfD [Eubacteriales bacterium]